MPHQTVARNLREFQQIYQMDGDVICCEACGHRQHVSWAKHPFPHQTECPHQDTAAPQPWAELHALLGQVSSVAKSPAPEQTRPNHQAETVLA